MRPLPPILFRPSLALHPHFYPSPLRPPHPLQRRQPSQRLQPLTTTTSKTPPQPAAPPRSNTDRGPPSTEDTQTDFGTMDVFSNTPRPTTAIDACLSDGFHLDNGIKITGGSGCLLVGGEAFGWRPWDAHSGRKGSGMVNKKGQWEVEEGSWGLLDIVWPKPDLLILGLGPRVLPLSPETRRYLGSLGIRVDVQDTRNAAAQFNLLATERGTSEVAAALVPLGWREPRG
ncbi:MAG: hypothetical protein Q9220_006729 [cf. Caloplaca sp. 1 TL-2023]